MKYRFFLALCAAVGLLLGGFALPAPAAPAAEAPPPSPAAPHTVRLSLVNARLEVQSTVKARSAQGGTVLVLPLPQEAEDLTLELTPPHAGSLRSWRMENTDAPAPHGTVGKERAALLARRDQTLGDVQGLKARLALWTTPATSSTALPPQEIEVLRRREENLRQIVPALTEELAGAQRNLDLLEQRLAGLPDTGRGGKQVLIAVDPALPEGTPVTVRHAYTLNNAAWQPRYTVEALTGTDQVRISLWADIQHYSGMDWSKARVELSHTAAQLRQPAPLRPWLVRKNAPEPRLEAKPQQSMEAAPALLLAAPRSALPLRAGNTLADAAALIPELREDPALAGWTLPQGLTLPEGKTTLSLLHETWDSPLQRVARPGNGDTRVWLLARHILHGKALPNGNATFLVDGASVGAGTFTPKNDEVQLFFGADPLVAVKNETDTRKSGKSGVVNKRQTWNWGWTYTVFNQRTKPVTVRIEDADTQAGDEAINVSYADTPAARKDENHTLWWEIEVPAQGTAEVRRSVNVNAPQDMHIQPGR